MKQTLFISFDLVRDGEAQTPLAIASILSYLKSDKELSDKMHFRHVSINMLDYGGSAKISDFEKYTSTIDFRKVDFIALSAYIWNEYLVNDFIRYLRLAGFQGKIILGGYQITYSNSIELSMQYPDTQFFVSGYAEQSLKDIFKEANITQVPKFLKSPVNFSDIPSPYLSNEIDVPQGTQMLRLETKRGCPYKCSFCAHRDLVQNKVQKHPLEKVFSEIAFINEKNVRKVNILDPVFNAGGEYLEIMREINRTNTTATYSLQSRLEFIKGETGKQFLDLCTDGNYHLEFGLQTSDVVESENIGRKNNMPLIDEAFRQLKEREITYEISLIYGLPGQTLDSFKRSINYVLSQGCSNIKAYPLMLLRGTELFNQKEQWGIKEEATGEFNIPVVTSSNSFTRDEWEQMNEISQNLLTHNRI